MAVAPSLPKLDPQDMKWARWVTNTLSGNSDALSQHSTQIAAINQQRGSVATQAAKPPKMPPTVPEVPVAPPQTPTAPLLSSDHGTVTIRWDGNMLNGDAGTQPQVGFAHVNVQRSTDGGNFTNIGTNVGVAGTIVDTNVVVGNTYWYRLVTTDTLGRTGIPSDSAAIAVVGVDLGSLADDLKTTIYDLQHSATTGGLVAYGDTPPTDPKYQVTNSIWWDTSDPTGAVLNRWDTASSTWLPVPYGTGAFGDGSIVGSKILAGSIDTVNLKSQSVTSDKVAAGAITTVQLGADAVTANNIAAHAIEADAIDIGAVQAEHMNIGAVPVNGSPTNRVPHSLNNSWWGTVGLPYYAATTGANLGKWAHENTGGYTVSTSGGLQMSAPAGATGYAGVMPIVSAPVSRKVNVVWNASQGVQLWVQTRDTADKATFTLIATDDIANVTFVLPTNAIKYGVYFALPGAANVTISQAQVFEIIGSGSQQHSELGPDGLRLYNDAGSLVVDLSSNSDNYFTIYNTGEAQATIDEDGNGTFQELMVSDEVNVAGNDLVGNFADAARADGTLDGPLLERLPRGVQYQATWDNLNGVVVSTQFRRIASGSFPVVDGRQYMILVDLGGLQVNNTSGVNIYIEFQLSTSLMQNIPDGLIFGRSVVYNGEHGYWAIPPISIRADASKSAVDSKNSVIPDGDIYWQINTNLIQAPTSNYTFAQWSSSANVTLVDMGPAVPLLEATDSSTGGAPTSGGAGGGGGGTSTSKSVTKTWTSNWSASWHDGGSTKVSGSGTYTDGNMLYQGLGVTSMGAKFGFPDITGTLSGKTITKVEVYLQNRWTYNSSGATCHLAGHNNGSEPGTYGSNVSGTSFTSSFSRGQGKWVTISNSTIPYSSWKSGAVKGIALTVQGTDAAYQYYDGVGKSKPPQLRITYHS